MKYGTKCFLWTWCLLYTLKMYKHPTWPGGAENSPNHSHTNAPFITQTHINFKILLLPCAFVISFSTLAILWRRKKQQTLHNRLEKVICNLNTATQDIRGEIFIYCHVFNLSCFSSFTLLSSTDHFNCNPINLYQSKYWIKW